MKATYWGPKTTEECKESIARYEERMKKRPPSKGRYQVHIDEARKNLSLLEQGAVFDIDQQKLVLK